MATAGKAPRKSAKKTSIPAVLTPVAEWAEAGTDDGLDPDEQRDQADALIAEVDGENPAEGERPADVPKKARPMFMTRRPDEDEDGDEEHYVFWSKPPLDWGSSVMTRLGALDYDGFAAKVLYPSSLALWAALDPTIREVNEMMGRWRQDISVNVGKSLPSTSSSRSTRRS